VTKETAVLLTAVVGGMIALQAPINSVLGKRIGTLPAASLSFAIGTAILIVLALTVGGGFGRLGEARHLEWYYLTGGALGAAYVTSVLVTVRTLGAGGVTAATIAGQLTAAVVVDQLGILGLEKNAVTMPRLIGIALLAAGTFLVVKY
jgi:bacterial/archaeal transporter family-2 protein